MAQREREVDRVHEKDMYTLKKKGIQFRAELLFPQRGGESTSVEQKKCPHYQKGMM